MKEHRPRLVRLPTEPIDRVMEPVSRFLHIEAASGVFLLLFTLLPLALANSPYADQFLAIWKTPISFSFGEFEMSHSLKHWINDGLMVIFFFVIGLEVKREIVLGELRDLRTAALPIAAALGGMIVPAGLYLMLQSSGPGQRGWGIPMATDIAFVVGCLALLGSRVPHGLRILLLSLSIADDIGAILVIAVGYTSGIQWTYLAWGIGGIGLVMLLARLGVRSVPVYAVLGLGIWYGFHESGVHATIAGVILGVMTPVRPWVSDNLLSEFVGDLGGFMEGENWQDIRERTASLRMLQRAARETISPLERLEGMLHPWVSFVIMPLFALANAGVPIRAESFAHPVALAVAIGLAVGKPLGIVVFSLLAVRSGLARLPQGVTWRVLAAGGILAGIGFTMSLFIAELALSDGLLDAAKIGALTGSAISSVIGMSLLWSLLPAPAQPH